MKYYLLSAVITYALLYLLGLAHTPFQNRSTLHEKFVERKKIGNSNDYWPTKHGLAFSGDDHVALFTGYANDYQGCKIVADLLNKKYSSPSLYTCNKTN